MRKSYQTILIILLQLSSVFLGYSQKNNATNSATKKIDSIMHRAINAGAFPGAVIMAGTSDSVIFQKSYGFLTYDSIDPVTIEHIFDIASITKILGATLVLMKMYEYGYLDLDTPVRNYVSGFWLNRRGSATLRELLAHQGGWQSWIRFYEYMQKGEGQWKKRFFRTKPSARFPFEVTQNLYLSAQAYNFIKRKIKRAEYSPTKGYEYSGLFFYLVPEMVENLTDTTYMDYLNYHVYEKMGLNTIGFQPRGRIPDALIVPTEIDTFFRQELIRGKVHDEGAILMRGVSGNAGLFSNARDLSAISQMLMQYGLDDTVRLFEKETVTLFTTAQFPNQGNRRALGFDKPLLEYDSIRSSVSRQVSHLSFGHTGYTGTILWIDPDRDLYYIFLCNRVFPSRARRMIYELNVRPEIHDLLYHLVPAKE